MIKINEAMIGQPTEIATGPPLFHAWLNVVKHPDKIEMIENEIAVCNPAQPDVLRLRHAVLYLQPCSAPPRAVMTITT